MHLAETDDDLSLGNIESARGRMEQQAGKYAEALAHFDNAVELYGRRDPNHRNLARALVNAVTVKRLIALQLRKRIDARAEQGAGGRRSGSAARHGPLHADVRARRWSSSTVRARSTCASSTTAASPRCW